VVDGEHVEDGLPAHEPHIVRSTMIRITPQHRDAVQALLDPGEVLVALTGVTRGTDLGTVGAVTNATVHDVAGYLREHGLTAMGLPGHAFAGGWVAVTGQRITFVVHKGLGFRAKPKDLVYSVPLDQVTLRWGDEQSAKAPTRIYHFHLDVGAQGGLDVVRRGFADEDGDAVVNALGDRATVI
jgi:hypothetical protein